MGPTMPIQRRIARGVTTPSPAFGFGGPGHEAVFVLDPSDYARQDPFILLADERLDMPAACDGGKRTPARRVRNRDVRGPGWSGRGR